MVIREIFYLVYWEFMARHRGKNYLKNHVKIKNGQTQNKKWANSKIKMENVKIENGECKSKKNGQCQNIKMGNVKLKIWAISK